MTDDEFRTWDRHQLENLLAQRDDALARIAVFEQEKVTQDEAVTKLKADHAEALAAKEAEVQALTDQHAEDQQMIVSLGGVDQAKRKIRDQRILALMAQQEAIGIELSKLTS